MAPERLVEMAQRLVAKGRDEAWDAWYRIALGDALSRAGRDQEALAAIGEECTNLNGKAVVARIHARAGRAEQARRWLRALDRDLEEQIRRSLLAFGALRQPTRTRRPMCSVPTSFAGRRMPRSARRLPSCGASG